MRIAAMMFCGMLGALGLFQASLAAGAPLGRYAWGGQYDSLPVSLRIGSLIAIPIYCAFAAIVLGRAGMLTLSRDSRFARYGAWIVTSLLLLGAVGNLVSPSPAEQLVMTPVALVLFILSLRVAMGKTPMQN